MKPVAPAKRRQRSIFRLRSPFKDPLRRSMFSVVGGALERVLAIDQINQVYYAAAEKKDDRHFMDKILDVLNISYEITKEDLARIPREGRVVVVANHPFGGIEGILLGALLKSVRSDVKLMANFILSRIPDLRDSFIFVDPFGRAGSARVNLKPLKESIQWLKQGHLLGIFPAGEVSHVDLKRGGIADPEWSTTIARLIRKVEAPVLPVYFAGSNGLLFQIMGLVHPRLRTAMLPHELLNKRDRTITVRIGNLIQFKKLERIEDDRAMMEYLRMRTYYLRHRPASTNPDRRRVAMPIHLVQPQKVPVAPATGTDLLVKDIEALPAEQKLVESGPLVVLHALAPQIPNVMREIGRLRELTFRDAGEGTGRALDIDHYDDYYVHLFIWNKDKQEIVGAYRLGQTDLILPRLGKRGLYTSTLFRYRAKLLKEISPALEMGRSFVRKEYQRSYAPLMLLFKGIAHFVAQHPRYKILFGPVSINSEYQTSSLQLLVSFLKMNNFRKDLARLVKARTPLRTSPLKKWTARKTGMAVRDLDEVEALIADIETELKGVPVLLKQYLKLGGKLLAFNIDPDFSNVLDGLILVDLRETNPALLDRYFGGKEVTDRFLAFHGVKRSADAGQTADA